MVDLLVAPPRGTSAATGGISVPLTSGYESVEDQRLSSGCSIGRSLARDRGADRRFARERPAAVAVGGGIGVGRTISVERVQRRECHVSIDLASAYSFGAQLIDAHRSSASARAWPQQQRWKTDGASSILSLVGKWGVPSGEDDVAQPLARGCGFSLHRHRQNGGMRGPVVVQATYGSSGRGGGWSGDGAGDGGARFHDSVIVQKEAEQIFKDFRLLSAMQPKFFNFDLEGKRIFVDKMEDFLERLRIFTMRYRLSSDPEAREVLRRLDAQLLEGSLTMDSMYTQLKKTVDMMRVELDHEEKLGPVAAAQLATARAAMESASGDMINTQTGMQDLASLLDDPEVIEALTEPEVLAAVQEVMRNPSAIGKYASNQKVATLLLKIFSKTSGDA